ncbi:hypothetical protein F4823DRAFT_588599 [Ustulina deusta]|nr:hypothetical protein F4823DRAFT_588599 [Ustulina deusta]
MLSKGLGGDATVIGAAWDLALWLGPKKPVYTQYIPDFSPLDLGIETVDGLMATAAPRNMVPFTRSLNFSTAIDGQTAMSIRSSRANVS